MIVGLEVCTEEEVEDQTQTEQQALIDGASTSDETTNRGSRQGRVVVTRRVLREVTGGTRDEQWVAMAQSCERLAPGESTVMRVRRRVVSEDEEV